VEEISADAMSAAQQFGQRVREARTRLGVSQEELAIRCGLHRTYVGSIERGERNVSLTNIVRLAAALGLDPADLVRGIVPPSIEDGSNPGAG
jgi:transcriptional regulator with XRE-family HTH domain